MFTLPPAWDDLLWTYQNLIVGLGVNALLGVSIYLVLAVGLLAPGQAAFMGLGAYASAMLSLHMGLPFAVILATGALVPALFAAAVGVPTLRLSGVYLAIATLGLGELLRAVYLTAEPLGGALGLSGIPERTGIWMIYATLAAALLALRLAGRSHVGRAMAAIRSDATAAAAMGIAVRRYRLGALLASAALAGLAGALSAHATAFIGPNDYGFEPAVSILAFALLGGTESALGAVLGAFVLTLLPEVLRPLADLRLVVNGLVIVAAVLFLPRGLLPLRPRRVAARGTA